MKAHCSQQSEKAKGGGRARGRRRKDKNIAPEEAEDCSRHFKMKENETG